MTPAEIFNKYLEVETEANKVIEGADHEDILSTLADEVGIDVEEVRDIVRTWSVNRVGV